MVDSTSLGTLRSLLTSFFSVVDPSRCEAEVVANLDAGSIAYTKTLLAVTHKSHRRWP